MGMKYDKMRFKKRGGLVLGVIAGIAAHVTFAEKADAAQGREGGVTQIAAPQDIKEKVQKSAQGIDKAAMHGSSDGDKNVPGALVTEAEIYGAVAYPGEAAEVKLKDLLRADYHQGKAHYYLNREKAGFMALERFDLALERGIGDIREVAYIKEDGVRTKRAVQIAMNWKNAFERAQHKFMPRQ